MAIVLIAIPIQLLKVDDSDGGIVETTVVVVVMVFTNTIVIVVAITTTITIAEITLATTAVRQETVQLLILGWIQAKAQQSYPLQQPMLVGNKT